jgi:16S rRNA processing protein RimM
VPEPDDGLVPIGRVGRPHGLDGAFFVERASEDEQRWVVGATVIVDGEPAVITLSRRAGGGRRAIRLDRAVERGAELTVPRSDLPEPGPESYYAFELVGLAVVDESGRELGRVVTVHSGLANDNLELDTGTLVPLIEDAIREIDVEAGRVFVAAGFLGG